MIWVFGDCTRRFSEIYEEILKSARKDCLTLAGELWYSFGGEFFIFGFDGDRSYVCICGECRKLMMRKGIEKGRTCLLYTSDRKEDRRMYGEENSVMTMITCKEDETPKIMRFRPF